MKLIKANTEKGNTNGNPRWVFDDGDSIVKLVPYIADDDFNIQPQIDLINSLHNKKLIHDDWKIKKMSWHTWYLDNGESSDKFIEYRMTKVPYVFELDKNISYTESKKNPKSAIYNDVDLYNEHILSKYIETNIKIFPYMNADGGYGNILQYDIGDWVIVDWDDCFLGAKRDAQEIGEIIVREAVESVTLLNPRTFNYDTLLEKYKKTIDFYKKSTYNTVLEPFEADLPTMASTSFKKLEKRMWLND